MEQVIFLHADEEHQETLSQMQRSQAQRLVLVAPAQIDHLRLSLLLRLARRSSSAQQLYLVSEDRLARMLAQRMGFAVAATLDEYRGLVPGSGSALRKRPSRPPARPALAAPRLPDAVLTSARSRLSEAPLPGTPDQPSAALPEKPRANLEKLLVDGSLPNPAAMPDLEEEEELAEREEQERLREERLHYEIDDEQPPSRAQQKAEQHEEQIISRILKTSRSGAEPPEPPAPPRQPSAERPGQGSPLPRKPEDGLRPLRTIDELLRERGQGEVFDWFERQAAEAAAALSGKDGSTGAAKSAGGAPTIETPQPPEADAGGAWRRTGRIARALKPARTGNGWRLRPPGADAWRRIGVISALALSLVMMGFGAALIPSAEVGYREEITPYSETLLLGAHPAGMPLTIPAQPGARVGADLARFDGILTTQAIATGQRAKPDDPDHPLAFPTQGDVDQLASHLQGQLQQWGEDALRKQTNQGDMLGPTLADEETVSFPPVGTSLPAGVSRFQVSVALHLRATLLRRQALLQAAQQRLRQDVSQVKPGFAPQPGQAPQLSILSVVPAGPGEAQLELLVRVRAAALIGPDLTPEQVRAAIAGQPIPDAEAYLQHRPGISGVSINVQPAWFNRLPFFPARIGITIVPIR
jgi:hypothetical protein